jgi:hypothetical protein
MANKQRTGAPTWAQFVKNACRLSHTPGFTRGATELLGEDAAVILTAWSAFCVLFDAFIAADDWPLEVDFTAPEGPGDEVLA